MLESEINFQRRCLKLSFSRAYLLAPHRYNLDYTIINLTSVHVKRKLVS